MSNSGRLLPPTPGRLDRIVQFVFRFPQILFRLGAMSGHVVVVGCASVFHLVDGLLYVVMDFFQIVPVMNLVGNRDSGSKRQTGRKSGNSNCFLHRFPPKVMAIQGTYEHSLCSPTATVTSK